MKKFLLSLCIFFCMSLSTARTFAQSADSLQVVIDTLSVKIAKLEHDLTYLKIDTNIRTLGAEIEILSIQVGNMWTDFQIGILSNNRDVKDLLQESYKTYGESVELVKEKVNFLQKLVNSSINSFSASENTLIYLGVMSILNSYYGLERKMSIIGEALDR